MERLHQLVAGDGALGDAEVERTLLVTPDLTDTIESIDREEGEAAPSGTVDGWSEGMEVTPGVTLERLIADGGMGSVWVARHARLGCVAVKLVAPSVLAKQPSLVERLDREAAALQRVTSSHIVQIYEHGTTQNGTPYIVMELLDGITLWRVVKRHGPLSLREVGAVLEQAAFALSAAHAEGIIHRDIKPQNVHLSARGGNLVVKLLDFGIAKEMEVNAVSSVTKTGSLVGTPHFMSPEQLLRPKEVDARTDLWSLGVLAYHALTGKFPFDGDTLAILFGNIISGEYEPPSVHRPHIPPEIDAWMAKALASEARERFRTAREQSVVFKRILLGLDPAVADERVTHSPRVSQRPRQVDPSSAPPAAPAPEAQPATQAAPLLPYPFALMQGAPDKPSMAPASSGWEDDSERRRKLLIIGAAAVVVLVIVVLVLT